MTTDILVDFDEKKDIIAEWIASLSGVSSDNICGIELSQKVEYPKVLLDEVNSESTHRPFRQTEEIDDQLYSVIYDSKKVFVDLHFRTRERGAYSEGDITLDAAYYLSRFQGGLYLPTTSIEFLSINDLSLLSVGNPIRDDILKNDGWRRGRVIEVGFGYVKQTREPLGTLDTIVQIVAGIHIGDQKEVLILTEFQIKSEKAQPGGYASLDTVAKIPIFQIPDRAIQQIFFRASEEEQLALTSEAPDFLSKSDICFRTDQTNASYIALNSDNNTLADWQQLGAGAGGGAGLWEESGGVTSLINPANKLLHKKGFQLEGPFHTPPVVLDNAAATINWDLTLAPNAILILNGNKTVNAVNPEAGQPAKLSILKPDGIINYSITWGIEFLWSNATAPLLTIVQPFSQIRDEIYLDVLEDGTSLSGAAKLNVA